jgi:hypothetical protein
MFCCERTPMFCCVFVVWRVIKESCCSYMCFSSVPLSFVFPMCPAHIASPAPSSPTRPLVGWSVSLHP